MTALKPANFAMIRTGGDDVSDFNVENMVLTPEDENNPELLAELASLTEDKSAATSKEADDNNKQILREEDVVLGLKREILKLKREGNIEEAKVKLKELNELEGKKIEPKDNLNNELKDNDCLISMPVNLEPVQPSSIQDSKPTSPKLQSSDAQVYRDLFSKLQKQSALCQTISEFYLNSNRKSDANLFIKRKQALDLEVQKLRLMLKSKQPAPPAKTVNVTYEYVLSNPEIPEGQLQVTFGGLKVTLPRKFKLKPDEEYKLRIYYELSGLSEKEMTLTSEPFTTQGLSKSKAKWD